MNDSDEEQLENYHVDYNEASTGGQDFTAPKGRQEFGLGGSQASQADQAKAAMGGLKDLVVGLGRYSNIDSIATKGLDYPKGPFTNAFGKFREMDVYTEGATLSKALESGSMVSIATETPHGDRLYMIGETNQQVLAALRQTDVGRKGLAEAGEPAKYLLISQGINPVDNKPEQKVRYVGDEDIADVIVRSGASNLQLNRHAGRETPLGLQGTIKMNGIRRYYGSASESADRAQEAIVQNPTYAKDERPVTEDDIRNTLAEPAPIEGLNKGGSQPIDPPTSDIFGTHPERKAFDRGCDIQPVLETGALYIRTAADDESRVIAIGKTPEKFDPSTLGGKWEITAGDPGPYFMITQITLKGEKKPSKQEIKYLDRADIERARVVKGESLTLSPNVERKRIVDVPGEVVSAVTLR